MINDFGFVQPGSLIEALDLLAADETLPLAGGTNVLVNMKRAPLETGQVLDLTKLEELKTIDENDDCVRIGAGVTIADLMAWRPGGVIEDLIHPMCAAFAGPLIRNLATVGGNICDASAAADLSPVILALDAQIELESAANGKRTMTPEEFFQGVRKTAIRQGELLTAVNFARPAENEHCYYYKLGKRKADAISIVSLAMVVKLENDRVIESRIALGAVAPVALRARTAEKTIEGMQLNDENINAAAKAAISDSSPIDDFRASADYRLQMVGALVEKGLRHIAQL